MKGTVNTFTLKAGFCPVRIGAVLHFEKETPCILVFNNKGICVGVVWEHREKRKSLANGQAEIRFFERFENEYGLWHRMFIDKQRLSYSSLMTTLEKSGEYVYSNQIKGY